jgi:hypothetical protein
MHKLKPRAARASLVTTKKNKVRDRAIAQPAPSTTQRPANEKGVVISGGGRERRGLPQPDAGPPCGASARPTIIFRAPSPD